MAAQIIFAPMAFALATAGDSAVQSEVPLSNPSFLEGTNANGAPVGWNLYGGRGNGQRISVIDAAPNQKALLIEDGDPAAEIGVNQTITVKPNEGYEVRVLARSVKDAPNIGANIQLRFLPSNTVFQSHIGTEGPDQFCETTVCGIAPPDSKSAVIYVYTHAAPTPKIMVGGVRLTAGVRPPPPAPPPVPPQYSKLKDAHLMTILVRDGRPLARIVVPASGIYARQAARLQTVVRNLTGCTVPIITDDAPESAIPVKASMIVLGNRSTNATISELYNRFFLLTDLRYPGPAGYEVRSIHNPFGGGHNVILAGASDAAGLDAAIETLASKFAEGAIRGSLSVGWQMSIKLGEGLTVPRELKEMELWEASAGYRSSGYFGWNSISKRMAAYYMGGDAFHAREALRLAFPDRQTIREIADLDGEMIENKDDPLAGPYHYNAHMMILFWDLIEESPVFSDEERLRVTNAFARQLDHRKDEGVYALSQAPGAVGSRHGQWSAVSLYCLGRYFQRDYPHPVWDQCVRGAQNAFGSLKKHPWINGENDNLFWYSTGIAPVFTHMLLTGDRAPLQNGVVAKLLRAQELLISGRVPDWALQYAALDYLHKVAFLTNDGRWLTYRDRTGIDTKAFRLGQSFWPPSVLRPATANDLAGKWTANPLPRPHWASRKSGIPLTNSIYNASFRSASDASGDFTLIDCFNGASRNPYHTFAILELRLAGNTLLQGYLNQVLTRADGAVEPRVAMDAALLDTDVIGQTAVCVAETPKAAFCNWRRTVAQRIGRYALVVDDLTYRTDSENMEVQFKWETQQRPFRLDATSKRLVMRDGVIAPAGVFDRTEILGGTASQKWTGAVRSGGHGIFFAIVAPGTNAACARLDENAAALALPQCAIASVGPSSAGAADLMVLAEDHLFAKGLRSAGRDSDLIRSDKPIDIDWDFGSGRMDVNCPQPTSLMVPAADKNVVLPVGRTTLEGVKPRDAVLRQLHETLRATSHEAGTRRANHRPTPTMPPHSAPALPEAFAIRVGGPVVDLIVFSNAGRERIAAASGSTIDLMEGAGRPVAQMRTDGKIRQLHWWPEARLLLAGCEDEKVCAFDPGGERKWTFVSEMDPAVFRAAKQYWFKSAPGHGGIHGLDTGIFLNGESQAFVGSACTLEIVGQDGKLVRRLPQFWGTVHKFAVVPASDDSLNLLASRNITDGPSLGIINSRTLDPRPRGFDGVPEGHTRVSGWSDQTRHHIFVEDLDADGREEVISEITGAWNRLTAWNLQGQPLLNVQFGPGRRNLTGEVRDLDVGPLLDGNKKSVAIGLAEGLLVTFDHRFEKLWSRRLPSPPVVLKIANNRIVVASENGSVSVFGGQGQLAATAKLPGRPTTIASLGGDDSVVIGADSGEIRAFRLAR